MNLIAFIAPTLFNVMSMFSGDRDSISVVQSRSESVIKSQAKPSVCHIKSSKFLPYRTTIFNLFTYTFTIKQRVNSLQRKEKALVWWKAGLLCELNELNQQKSHEFRHVWIRVGLSWTNEFKGTMVYDLKFCHWQLYHILRVPLIFQKLVWSRVIYYRKE